MNRATQADAILTHMRRKGSITPIRALKLYGCFRLAARILDLKREGFLINSTMCNRNGRRYAAYSLVGKRKAA
jgi:hypothetical protein